MKSPFSKYKEELDKIKHEIETPPTEPKIRLVYRIECELEGL
jgi:hypothetical protein